MEGWNLKVRANTKNNHAHNMHTKQISPLTLMLFNSCMESCVFVQLLVGKTLTIVQVVHVVQLSLVC